jgi:hypothetical protein
MFKKISILLGSSIGLFVLWLLGLEKAYAAILKFGASLILSPFSNLTPLLKTNNGHPDFCVAVGQEGYCMQLELFGLSVIVMLSWYILLISSMRTKKIALMAAKHLGIFYLLQILTMASLALYGFSPIFQEANDALRQSFIIIALIFIIRDNYIYGIFTFKKHQD